MVQNENLLNVKYVDFREKDHAENAISILQKAVKTREEQQFLKRGIQGLSLFERNNEIFAENNINHQLFKEISLAFYPKGSVLFHTGEQGETYFIALIGSVFCLTKNHANHHTTAKSTTNDIEKQSSSPLSMVSFTGESDQNDLKNFFPDHMWVKTYLPGEAFGEISLMTNAPRTATMVCNEDSYFMTLTKVGFENIVGRYHEAIVRERLRFLQSYCFLRNIADSKLLQLLHFFKVRESVLALLNIILAVGVKIQSCQKGKVLFKQGDIADTLYFLKSGEVEMFKYVTLDDGNNDHSKKELPEPLQKLISVAIASGLTVVGGYEIHSGLTTRDSQAVIYSSTAEVYVIEKKKLLSILVENNCEEDFKKSCAAKCAFANQRELNAQIAHNIELKQKSRTSFQNESATMLDKIQKEKLASHISVLKGVPTLSQLDNDEDDDNDYYSNELLNLKERSNCHLPHPNLSTSSHISDFLSPTIIPSITTSRRNSACLQSAIRGSLEPIRLSFPLTDRVEASPSITVVGMPEERFEKVSLQIPLSKYTHNWRGNGSRQTNESLDQKSKAGSMPEYNESNSEIMLYLKDKGLLHADAEMMQIRSTYNEKMLKFHNHQHQKHAKGQNIFQRIEDEIKKVAQSTMSGSALKKTPINIFSCTSSPNSPTQSSPSQKAYGNLRKTQRTQQDGSPSQTPAIPLFNRSFVPPPSQQKFSRSSQFNQQIDRDEVSRLTQKQKFLSPYFESPQSYSPQMPLLSLPALKVHHRASNSAQFTKQIVVNSILIMEDTSKEEIVNLSVLNDLSGIPILSSTVWGQNHRQVTDRQARQSLGSFSPAFSAQSPLSKSSISFLKTPKSCSLSGSPLSNEKEENYQSPLVSRQMQLLQRSQGPSRFKDSVIDLSENQQRGKSLSRSPKQLIHKQQEMTKSLKNTRSLRSQLLTFDDSIKDNVK